MDGLRFLAILPVLILHSTGHFLSIRLHQPLPANWAKDSHILRVIEAGYMGVQVFFVLSGFVVALPFARHWLRDATAPRLSRYFLRRVTRIEPPYILSLTVMYLIVGHYARLFPHYVAGLFYVHQLIFSTLNPINVVTWSLEAEVFFYVLAPWLTSIYRIRGDVGRWLLQLLVIGSTSYVIATWVIPYGPRRWIGTLVTTLPYFLTGILLADFYASGVFKRSKLFIWDIALVASGMGVIYAAAVSWRIFWLTPFMIGIIFIGAMEGRLANWLFILRPVTIIGGMCYTAYLWHIPVLIEVLSPLAHIVPRKLSNSHGAIVFCLMSVPILIAVTAPIFYFLEKPFMNRGRGSQFLERFLYATSEAFRRQPVLDYEEPT